MSNERATDEELVELFDCENVQELESIAVEKRDILSIQTCYGQWVKFYGTNIWFLQPDSEGDL